MTGTRLWAPNKVEGSEAAMKRADLDQKGMAKRAPLLKSEWEQYQNVQVAHGFGKHEWPDDGEKAVDDLADGAIKAADANVNSDTLTLTNNITESNKAVRHTDEATSPVEDLVRNNKVRSLRRETDNAEDVILDKKANEIITGTTCLATCNSTSASAPPLTIHMPWDAVGRNFGDIIFVCDCRRSNRKGSTQQTVYSLLERATQSCPRSVPMGNVSRSNGKGCRKNEGPQDVHPIQNKGEGWDPTK